MYIFTTIKNNVTPITMNYINRLILILNLNPSKRLKTSCTYFTTEEMVKSLGVKLRPDFKHWLCYLRTVQH